MRKIAGYLTKYGSKKFRLSEGKVSGACHTASVRNLCKWPENRPKHARKQYSVKLKAPKVWRSVPLACIHESSGQRGIAVRLRRNFVFQEFGPLPRNKVLHARICHERGKNPSNFKKAWSLLGQFQKFTLF